MSQPQLVDCHGSLGVRPSYSPLSPETDVESFSWAAPQDDGAAASIPQAFDALKQLIAGTMSATSADSASKDDGSQPLPLVVGSFLLNSERLAAVRHFLSRWWLEGLIALDWVGGADLLDDYSEKASVFEQAARRALEQAASLHPATEAFSKKVHQAQKFFDEAMDALREGRETPEGPNGILDKRLAALLVSREEAALFFRYDQVARTTSFGVGGKLSVPFSEYRRDKKLWDERLVLALRHLQESLELDPGLLNTFNVQQRMGAIQLERGNASAALLHLEIALGIAERFKTPMPNVIVEEMAELMHEALRGMPQEQSLIMEYENLAAFLRKRGAVETAGRVLEEGIALAATLERNDFAAKLLKNFMEMVPSPDPGEERSIPPEPMSPEEEDLAKSGTVAALKAIVIEDTEARLRREPLLVRELRGVSDAGRKRIAEGLLEAWIATEGNRLAQKMPQEWMILEIRVIRNSTEGFMADLGGLLLPHERKLQIAQALSQLARAGKLPSDFDRSAALTPEAIVRVFRETGIMKSGRATPVRASETEGVERGKPEKGKDFKIEGTRDGVK